MAEYRTHSNNYLFVGLSSLGVCTPGYDSSIISPSSLLELDTASKPTPSHMLREREWQVKDAKLVQ